MALGDYTNLGVRTLKEEVENPGKPELKNQGWNVTVEKLQAGFTYFKIVNPDKGVIDFKVVRALKPDHTPIVWSQPVIYENPGAIIAPVRRIPAGKGRKQDKIIVYLLIVDRPVINPRVNVDPKFLPTKGVVNVSAGSINTGIRSVEFARGIGGSNGSKSTFKVSDMWKAEKIQLVGSIQIFNSVAEEEMSEEVPEFKILPGAEPILVSAINPNTALFATMPACFIVPISPDIKEADEKVQSPLAQQELIRGIIPLEFPDEVDQLLDKTERLVQAGAWDSREPVVVEGWTLSIFHHLGRLLRQDRIPITG